MLESLADNFFEEVFSILGGIHAIIQLLHDFSLDVEVLVQKVERLEKQLADLTRRRQEEREKLAARQVLHQVNEKVLGMFVTLHRIPEETFWAKYRISNVRGVEHHPDLMELWPTVRERLGLDASTTPKVLWRQLKFGKEPLDKNVHEGSYDKLPYDDLKRRADKIFDGELKKFKGAFLFFLELSEKKLGGDLYGP